MIVPHSVYRFGDVQIDPGAAELRRAGQIVHLEPKVLQVLVYLLENRQRVVPKKELLDAVWQEAFVTENALTKAIGRLRQALDDDPQDPRSIQTVHTVGYRFIAEVAIAPVKTEPPNQATGGEPAAYPARHLRPSQAPGAWAALLLALVLVGGVIAVVTMRGSGSDPVEDEGTGQPIRSVAVLPLANLTGDPEQEYLVDAIHDALIGELAQLEPLRVISRQSTLPYRDTDKSMPQIAEELAVDALIEGSVLRDGNRVRVSAQIILGPRDEHLWAESFERGAGNVLVLVSDLARAIGDEVEIVLTPERQSLLAAHRALSPEVEDAYLRARYSMSLGSATGVTQAKELFARAVELDPGFARAHAGLAGTYFLQALLGQAPHQEAATACKEAALAALELDANLADAWSVLGMARLYFDWDWPAAGRELSRALELSPNDPLIRHGYGDYLLVMGLFEDSLEQVRIGRLYDPASPLTVVPVVAHLVFLRRFDEAIAEAEAILEASPEVPIVRTSLATALWAQGRFEESLEVLRQRWQTRSPELVEALDRGHAASGPAGAMRAVAETLAAVDPGRRADAVWIARCFALGDDPDRAFEFLDQAVDSREPTVVHLHANPDFDGLRSDPRYFELLRRIGLPASTLRESVPAGSTRHSEGSADSLN